MLTIGGSNDGKIVHSLYQVVVTNITYDDGSFDIRIHPSCLMRTDLIMGLLGLAMHQLASIRLDHKVDYLDPNASENFQPPIGTDK